MAEIRGETGFLSCIVASGGAALCIWRGREGEIPDVNADAGEIHRLPGGFLLSDVQPLSSIAEGAADGGEWAFG